MVCLVTLYIVIKQIATQNFSTFDTVKIGSDCTITVYIALIFHTFIYTHQIFDYQHVESIINVTSMVNIQTNTFVCAKWPTGEVI